METKCDICGNIFLPTQKIFEINDYGQQVTICDDIICLKKFNNKI